MFILNKLTLGDFIDIFLYKKELRNFGKINEEKIILIMKEFKRVDALFKEIESVKAKKKEKEKENDDYSNYFYIFYNYERWFFIKIGRPGKDKKNEELKNE